MVVQANSDLNNHIRIWIGWGCWSGAAVFGVVSNGGDARSGATVLGDIQVVVMQFACGDLRSKVMVY